MKNLISLYYVSSPSSKEKKMRKFLKQWLNRNVPTAQVFADESGIYVTKGYAETFPCIVAHIDEVHNERNNDYRVIVSGDYIFGWNVAKKSTQGIGADDKNGIWIAMQCLLKYDNVKVALFVGEEIGCVGSEKANMDFFKNCRFVIQCDRRGSDDFITCAGGQELCDDDFLSKIDMAKFGYKEATGLMTDVMQLKENGLQVAACNLSCGYYNPHTADETTVFSELCNCRDLVYSIIDNVTEQCAHAPKRSYYGYGYGSYFSDYGARDYNDDKWRNKCECAPDNELDTLDYYTEDERLDQFAEMYDYMWQELSADPDGFNYIEFYDVWKYSFRALRLRDYEDAYKELSYYLNSDDDDDKTATVG